eukprot:51959-Prymnesium_polylepis.1
MEGRPGVVRGTGAPGIRSGAAWGARPWRISQPVCALDLCDFGIYVFGLLSARMVYGLLYTKILRWKCMNRHPIGPRGHAARHTQKATDRVLGRLDAPQQTCGPALGGGAVAIPWL